MKKSSKVPHISDGHVFEQEVFGYYSEGSGEGLEYKDFKDSFDEAIAEAEKRSWDPKNPPEGTLIKVLFDEIVGTAESWGIPYEFEVWPTLGTTMDFFHGVDGFFVATHPETSRKEYIYIDVSLFKKGKKNGFFIYILNKRSFEYAKSVAEKFIDIFLGKFDHESQD